MQHRKAHEPSFLAAGILLLLMAGPPGCGPQDDEGSPTPGTETPVPGPTSTPVPASTTPTPTESPDTYMGYDFSGVEIHPDRFSLVVDGDIQFGVPDQPFTLTARVTGGVRKGDLSFAWTVSAPEAATLSASGAEAEVRFSEPGDYLVQVEATDEDGEQTRAGAYIRVFELDPGTPFAVGDLDGDGAVTTSDVELLESYLSGKEPFDRDEAREADVDRNGVVDEVDAVLIQEAVDAGERAPTHLSSLTGHAGARFLMIHPALLHPDRVASVSVTTVSEGTWDSECLTGLEEEPRADQVPFVRGAPGYLTFALPIRFACLTSAEEVSVELTTTDGAESETFTVGTVTVNPLEPAGDPAGDLVLEAMARMRMAMEEAADTLETYADLVGAGDEERAVLMGTWAAALDMLAEAHEQFHVAFEDLDEVTRAMFEQLARSSGLADSVALLRERTETLKAYQRIPAMTPDQGELMADILCTLHALEDVSIQVASVSMTVGDILGIYEHFPIGRREEIGPILEFIANITVTVHVSIDVAKLVEQYLPSTGDELTAQASPDTLFLGDSTELSASIDLVMPPGLCDGGDPPTIEVQLGAVVEFYMDSLPADNNQVFRFGTYLEEHFDEITARIEAVILDLIPASLEVEVPIAMLTEKICDTFQDETLPLDPSFLQASCGGLADDHWTCEEACLGLVTFSGKREVCEQELDADAKVQCEDPDAGPPNPPPVVAAPPAEGQEKALPPPESGDSPPYRVHAYSTIMDEPSGAEACPDESSEDYYHIACGGAGAGFTLWLDYDILSGDGRVGAMFLAATALDPDAEPITAYWEFTGMEDPYTGEGWGSVPLPLTIADDAPPGEYQLDVAIAPPGETDVYDPTQVSNYVSFDLVVVP